MVRIKWKKNAGWFHEYNGVRSKFLSKLPGDIISTGTPPGVGMGMKPQVFLKPGDVMRLGIEGLGEQTQKTFAAE